MPCRALKVITSTWKKTESLCRSCNKDAIWENLCAPNIVCTAAFWTSNFQVIFKGSPIKSTLQKCNWEVIKALVTMRKAFQAFYIYKCFRIITVYGNDQSNLAFLRKKFQCSKELQFQSCIYLLLVPSELW